MRVKKFGISKNAFCAHFFKGAVTYKVIGGIPEDAILRDVRLAGMDPTDGRVIEFLFEHESFPELPEAVSLWDAPDIMPEYLIDPVEYAKAVRA